MHLLYASGAVYLCIKHGVEATVVDLHVSLSSDKSSMHVGELLHTHTGANKVNVARQLTPKEVLIASKIAAKDSKMKRTLDCCWIIAKDFWMFCPL